MSASLRIFISTGEVSGDLQGSLLVEALYRQAQVRNIDLEVVALGGERMSQAGARLLANTSGIGSVGLLESIPYILPTLNIQQRAQRYLQKQLPDLVVLIDYVGPNLSLGQYLHSQLPQLPIVYYIAPQAWIVPRIWGKVLRPKTTQQIVRFTDRILAIFLGEADYFRHHGANVTWVGHPLVDRMQAAPDREQARAALGVAADCVAIALLPASRQQEIANLMPAIFQAAQHLQAKIPQAHFWIPLSLERYRPAVEQAIERYGLRATLVSSQSSTNNEFRRLCALAAADLAITKSGTVNLELALLNVPQVVLYRVNPITAWLAFKVLNFSVPFMSLANLVPMKPIVPELLQTEATPKNIVQVSLELLFNPRRRQQMLADYQSMCQVLGEVGACDRAAQEIFRFLQES